MKPWLVFSAQAEWILPPTKYRLSKTCAESAYHTSRAGTALGSRTKSAGSLVGGLALAPSSGIRPRPLSRPTCSNPAAFCAARRASTTSSSQFLTPCAGVSKRVCIFESPKGVSRPSLWGGVTPVNLIILHYPLRESQRDGACGLSRLTELFVIVHGAWGGARSWNKLVVPSSSS